MEEERRLCFVGMTRAMKELHLTHARLREFRGQLNYAIPSSFLDELPRDGVEHLDPAMARNYARTAADEWRAKVGPAARDWADTGARPFRPPDEGRRTPPHDPRHARNRPHHRRAGAARRIRPRHRDRPQWLRALRARQNPLRHPGRKNLHRGQGETKSGGAEEGVSHRLYGLGVASALGFDFSPTVLTAITR